MLQIVKQLHGAKLAATDGHIGHVKNVYFDDQNWAVRYLVVDTGSWIPGRLVLLSPHALGSIVEGGKALSVQLTREQIENSPSIESHKPISRQYEEEYFRYYGWPSYWQGGSLWGMSSFPGALWDGGAIAAVPAPISMPAPGTEPESDHPGDQADSHLRSVEAVVSYAIEASDGMIGHIEDFVMDEQSWEIRQLVVETGHLFAGKKIGIATSDVEGVSYDDFKVVVNLTTQKIEEAPAL